METNNQLPVVLEHHRNIVATLQVDPTVREGCFWTTLPADTPAAKGLIAALLQRADFSGEEVLGHAFVVQHVLTHTVTLSDAESGEVVQGVRTVLCCQDGSTVSFCSLGVLESLRALSDPRLFGPPPWVPGVEVTLRQKRTRSKRLMYYLEASKG